MAETECLCTTAGPVKEESKVEVTIKAEPCDLLHECRDPFLKCEHVEQMPGGLHASNTRNPDTKLSDEACTVSEKNTDCDTLQKWTTSVWFPLHHLPEVRIYLQRCDSPKFSAQDSVSPEFSSNIRNQGSIVGKTIHSTRCNNFSISKLSSASRQKCPLCGTTSSSVGNLDRHIQSFHPNAEFRCRFCPEVFKKMFRAERHEQETHPDKSWGRYSGIRCEFCFKIFKSTELLLMHRTVHTGKKPFRCKFCSNSFTNTMNRRKHEQRKHTDKVVAGKYSERKWKCQFCLSVFYDKVCVEVHERSVHGGEKKHSCRFCPHRFLELRDKRVHENKYHAEEIGPEDVLEKYKCEVCGKEFYWKNAFNGHMKIHAGIKDVACSFCSTMFRSRGDKKSHELHRHSDEFLGGREALKVHKCDQCAKGFVTKSARAHHMKSHVIGRNYKCSLCDKSYLKKANATFHERHCGSNDKESFKKHACSWCEKKFMTKAEMKQHEATHTGFRPFECKSCDKRFSSSYNLTMHTKRVHASNPEEKQALLKHGCSLCPKKFILKAELEAHKRSHSDEQSFECRFCPSKFKILYTLRLHEVKNHVKDRADLNYLFKFCCKFCSQRFNSSTELSNHERRHTGEKPFECDGCFTRFQAQRNLREHKNKCEQIQKRKEEQRKKREEPVYRYSCSFCPRKFLFPSFLKAHAVSHSEARPLKCDNCPKAFKDLQQLRRHSGRVHPQLD